MFVKPKLKMKPTAKVKPKVKTTLKHKSKVKPKPKLRLKATAKLKPKAQTQYMRLRRTAAHSADSSSEDDPIMVSVCFFSQKTLFFEKEIWLCVIFL